MKTISFPNMFNKNSRATILNLSGYINSINESLKILLSVNSGELLGDPAYGTSIKSALFELKTNSNQYFIKKMISEKINKYEPRITTNESLIKIYNNPNDNSYKITIKYYLKQYTDLYDFEMIIGNI